MPENRLARPTTQVFEHGVAAGIGLDVIASRRIDLWPLVTHHFKLDEIEQVYELFSHQRDGVLKVAITN